MNEQMNGYQVAKIGHNSTFVSLGDTDWLENNTPALLPVIFRLLSWALLTKIRSDGQHIAIFNST